MAYAGSVLHVKGRFELAYSRPAQAQFEVVVQDCRWKIKLYDLGPDKVAETYDAFYDGTDTGLMAHFRKNTLSPDGVNTGNAVFERTDVPVESEILIIPIWIAYASGCVLKTDATSVRYLISNGNTALREIYRHPVSVKSNKTPPFLPATVEFFSDGRVLPTKGRDLSQRILPPFESGYLLARHSSDDFSDVSAMRIPRKFFFELFAPMSDGISTNDIKKTMTFSGIAESISVREESDIDFVPRTDDGPLLVEDRRFLSAKPAVSYISYLLTNKMASTSHPALVAVYNQQVRSDRGMALDPNTKTAPIHRYSTIAFIVVAICIPPALYFLRKRQK